MQRAYSQFQGNYRDGYEPYENFALALKDEESRIADNWHLRWHYRSRGYYYTQLKRYYELFNPEQIKVYLYEDYLKDSIGFTQDIFRFIGVDDTFVPEMNLRLNVSPKKPKNKTLDRYLKTLKKELPLGKNFVERLIQFNSSSKKVPLKPEVRQGLIQEYREEILQLQETIDRDLSHWLELEVS